jgi:site-specific recombinase XerD
MQPSEEKDTSHDVKATSTQKHILLKLPRNVTDILFIRNLGNVYWDKTAFCWVIAKLPVNIDKINRHFAGRISWVEAPTIDRQKTVSVPVEPGTLQIIKYQNGRIRLIFPYYPALVAFIKQQPFYCWEPDNHWWTLPHTEKILAKLIRFCKDTGWKYYYVEDIRTLKRKVHGGPVSMAAGSQCPDAYLEKLSILRYSKNTIRIYRDCFTEFINFLSGKKLEEVKHSDILSYLRYLVEERCVSTSYQNQAINAVKFYFEKVQGGKRETYFIERPRSEKFLPEVLSEEEVISVIGTISNLKHKCMIMASYSAGLRVGELLNLRIKDIDSKRMLIRISQGKGKRDRVTLLSRKLLELLRNYYKQYHPREWLFEGIAGGRYSERSIQNVLKKACRKAGIRKHVTMHTLRHSFATHLLENNTDIRYIQELLGHANPKTTQIYTHITTRGLDQIKSPLDNLDVK